MKRARAAVLWASAGLLPAGLLTVFARDAAAAVPEATGPPPLPAKGVSAPSQMRCGVSSYFSRSL